MDNNQPACAQAGGPPGPLNLTCGLLAVRRRQQICIKVSIVLHTVRRRTYSVILPGRFSKRSYVAAAHRTVAMCFCFCAQLSHRKGSHGVNVCGRKRFFFLLLLQFQDVEGKFRNRAVWKSVSSREPKGGRGGGGLAPGVVKSHGWGGVWEANTMRRKPPLCKQAPQTRIIIKKKYVSSRCLWLTGCARPGQFPTVAPLEFMSALDVS